VTTVCAVLTVHNRRHATLRCLASLHQGQLDGIDLTTIVVDDGSTDGTADAIREAFPGTRIIAGDGNLYWTGGMALAEATALSSTDADFLLWVNDDVQVDDGGLRGLVDEAAAAALPRIVVGSLVDPRSGNPTYGGFRRDRLRPMRFIRVEPAETAQPADAFNGSLVLVPRRVAEALGGVDTRYPHLLADLDYGLRARRMGVPIVVAGGVHGTCVDDHVQPPFERPGLKLRERIAILHQTPHMPWRARLRFLSRHGGPLWPVYLPSVYLKLVLRSLTPWNRLRA
jgi:GT2 family glycosyltransferase